MYDAIVVGLGGMGSAALYELAQRGLHVLGLEQFDIPHVFGSSHGNSRIIRLAYFESPTYVPLLKRSYERWRELERIAGEQLLWQTGSIDVGPESSVVFLGSRAACEEHRLAHEVLDSLQLMRRFPGYRLEPGMVGIFQPDGGFLVPERCVVNYLELARQRGASVVTRERVIDWTASVGGASVRTTGGEYSARRLVITAGPWSRQLIPLLKDTAIPERQVVLWTDVGQNAALFDVSNFPVFNLQTPEGDRYYGFPSHQGLGFKIGKYHHFHQHGDPEALDRTVDQADELILRAAIERFFPLANGPALESQTCLFTNTPDEHFVLARYPHTEGVAIAAGFSGHGFKFCSVVGEIMADLVLNGETSHDLSLFALDRPSLRLDSSM